MTVTAEIVDVRPLTVYQGTVYEHLVIVRVRGEQFGLFDPDKHASDSMIGNTYEIEILPFLPSEVKSASEEELGVVPSENDPDNFQYHSYYDTIEGINSGWPREVTIGIGSGTVSVTFHEKNRDLIDPFTTGDLVKVTTIRSDLRRVIQ